MKVKIVFLLCVCVRVCVRSNLLQGLVLSLGPCVWAPAYTLRCLNASCLEGVLSGRRVKSAPFSLLSCIQLLYQRGN